MIIEAYVFKEVNATFIAIRLFAEMCYCELITDYIRRKGTRRLITTLKLAVFMCDQD